MEERETIEQNLGQVMHKISRQQNVVQKENKKLQELQAEANNLDEELTELDGE